MSQRKSQWQWFQSHPDNLGGTSNPPQLPGWVSTLGSMHSHNDSVEPYFQSGCPLCLEPKWHQWGYIQTHPPSKSWCQHVNSTILVPTNNHRTTSKSTAACKRNIASLARLPLRVSLCDWPKWQKHQVLTSTSDQVVSSNITSKSTLWLCQQFAIENCHRNSEFSYEQVWFSMTGENIWQHVADR